MIYCGSFAGTWNYRSQKKTYDLIEHHVKTGHGPLGALYPQDYVSEGDSPAFLYSIQNGLRNHEHPTFGGWGGRFEKVDGFDRVYRDAVDDGDKKKSLRIWIDDANNDFQARMDWCVAEKFEDANHPPVLKISGDVDRNVKAGSRIAIDASETRDPDGDQLKYRWWQYKEAGSLDSPVELTGADTNRVTFVAPKVRSPGTIHIILEAADNGRPQLKSYQRVIVDVRP